MGNDANILGVGYFSSMLYSNIAHDNMRINFDNRCDYVILMSNHFFVVG